MLKAGLIGCGRIVEQGHVPAFEELAGRVQVVAVSDPVEARRNLIGDRLGVPAAARFADYHDMLKLDGLDFVDMALPHFLHEEAIVAAAKAGQNILTEKPLTTSMASANRIIDAVEKAGVKMCVIHNYRHGAAAAKAIELAKSGVIGQPFLIRYEYLGGSHYAGAAGYDPDWRTKSGRGGGGALIDNGYHYLYMAETLMGSPIVQAYGRVGTWVQHQDVEDIAAVLLAHANGGTTSLQSGWGVKGGGQAVGEVHGTLGSLRFVRGGNPLEIYINAEGQWKPVELENPNVNAFAGIFSRFFDAMETGGPMPVSVYEARHNLAIVMSGYASSKSGQAVNVSDVEFGGER
ncbi:MAG: Gfo/Idh/MocA family oxidoreductase [Chloroflexi bacterium]|nr:Gfo/Idh/MocA family oxidoreductase [Chloroflexota bacterium]